ncbi:MAG: hypothetical protein HOP29_13550 [Phycisphaerales bacterium]|nr:hypothetical protein [Phycisphaerales bacterium]
MIQRVNWVRRMLAAVAAGGMVMAFSASCDPTTGGVYIDRYDEDDFDGFFDFGVTVTDVYYEPPLFGEIVIHEIY